LAADRELATLAARGVEFLVVPKTSFEWLAAHPVLGEALKRSHRMVTRQQHICEIYELIAAPDVPVAAEPDAPARVSAPPRRQRTLLERIGLRAGQLDGR
jgi:hypothetical protein